MENDPYLKVGLIAVWNYVSRPDSPFSAAERLVACAVASHLSLKADIDANHQVCWPSVARVQEQTHLGRTKVKAALKRLSNGPDAPFDRVRPWRAMRGYLYTLRLTNKDAKAVRRTRKR